MRFNVEGADAASGADRVIQVDAANEREAETAARAEGVLAAAVYPATTKSEDEALEELAAAAQAGKVVEYRTPTTPRAAPLIVPPRSPTYAGLTLGGSVLRIFGALSVIAGLLVLFAGFQSGGIAAWNRGTNAGWIEAITGLLLSLWPIASGLLLYAAGEGCIALRDIARNSWG